MSNNSSTLKQLLLARATPATTTGPSYSARYHAAATAIAKRISKSVSRASAKAVTINWPLSPCTEVDWQSKLPALQISLRLYGQRLQLYLSLEVVTELCDGLLHSESNFILSELTEKDSISIGYLVGLVLNDNAAFPGERAYLQGVEIVESLPLSELNEQRLIELPIAVGGCSTTCLLTLDHRLQKIFEENAARLPSIANRRAWFEPIILHGNVTAKIIIDDLHALLGLAPGMRLAISLKEASLVLSQARNKQLSTSRIALSYCNKSDTETFQLYF